MNKKDKFFMLLALSCLPLSEMAAEQVDGMAVSPITQEVLQNSVKITGKVVDVQGEPVIGATVMEKGTTNGIITDVDGNFTFYWGGELLQCRGYSFYLAILIKFHFINAHFSVEPGFSAHCYGIRKLESMVNNPPFIFTRQLHN